MGQALSVVGALRAQAVQADRVVRRVPSPGVHLAIQAAEGQEHHRRVQDMVEGPWAPARLWWPSSESDGALPEGVLPGHRQACAAPAARSAGSVSMLAPSGSQPGERGPCDTGWCHAMHGCQCKLARGRAPDCRRRQRPVVVHCDTWPGVRLAFLCMHGEGCLCRRVSGQVP